MKKILLYSFILLQSASCTLYRPFSSKLKPSEIQSVGILPSISIINLISTNRDEISLSEKRTLNFSQRLSDSTTSNTEEILDFVNISHKTVELDSIDYRTFNNELLKIVKIMSAFSYKNSDGLSEILKTKQSQIAFEKIVISDSVVNILKKNNQRFALSVFINGNTRTTDSDTDRKLKNTASQILGVGMAALVGVGFYSKEIPYSTSTYVFIIDTQTKKLAMFSTKNEIIDPMNNSLVKKQLYSCFEDYWIWYHPEAQKYLKITKK